MSVDIISNILSNSDEIMKNHINNKFKSLYPDINPDVIDQEVLHNIIANIIDNEYEIIKFFLREKDFNLVIASPDFQVKNLDSENIHLLSRYLSDQEIKWLYTNAYFSLGQFGRTKRQQRSIPHKYFEASYFGCSYVSLKSTALNEMGISAGVIQIDTIDKYLQFFGT